jgi:hypothetical protein
MKTKKLTTEEAELARNRQVRSDAQGKTEGERSNEEIIVGLKARHITVERERYGQNGENEVFKAVWNNGNEPLEAHTLTATGFREALLEAENILVEEEERPARTAATGYQGFRGTAPAPEKATPAPEPAKV